MAADYLEELESYGNPIAAKDKIHTIQLPFVPQVIILLLTTSFSHIYFKAPTPKVDPERKNQIRKEQGQRLKEINERKKEKKVLCNIFSCRVINFTESRARGEVSCTIRNKRDERYFS